MDLHLAESDPTHSDTTHSDTFETDTIETGAIVPVILSGGAGSRLWPLSRETEPKQFLPLRRDRTQLQETATRNQGFGGATSPIVVCNEAHRFLAADQLRAVGVDPDLMILEPVGRNTAPAVALAALAAMELHDDPILLVLPSDHLIRDDVGFARSVASAAVQAGEGRLVTFGVTPTSPSTGLGYIKMGAPLDGCGFADVHAVEAFVEKPSAETAGRYVDAGGYAWNSGIFMFRASRYLEELELFRPDIVAACGVALLKAVTDGTCVTIGGTEFADCPAESIDYAVMEHTRDAVVLPIDVGWSDLGSWSALWDVGCPDADGNVTRGDVIVHASHGSYVHAGSKLVALVGVDDVVVVETVDAVLVARRDRAQELTAVVARLKSDDRPERLAHRRVRRPWGCYDSIDVDDRFQVKRITVQPGAALSDQMHHHRSEHWVVVRGTARVTLDNETFLLSENESTFIPLGSRHRVENPGKVPLELIEVQTGSYLGEDDIERFADVYGRAAAMVGDR